MDFDFFKTLREAGCSNIRFGVDGWCDDTLKLQRKGYNMKIVESVLSAAKKAGMYVSTNIVLGMPGETEEMIDESIENIVQLEKYIDIVESINTLLLNAGSCYYSDPDEYKIKFRGDKEEIYSNNAHIIPTELWYSDEPYIDQKVRNKRLEKICVALDSSNIILGDFAKGIISKTLKEES